MESRAAVSFYCKRKKRIVLLQFVIQNEKPTTKTPRETKRLIKQARKNDSPENPMKQLQLADVMVVSSKKNAVEKADEDGIGRYQMTKMWFIV